MWIAGRPWTRRKPPVPQRKTENPKNPENSKCWVGERQTEGGILTRQLLIKKKRTDWNRTDRTDWNRTGPTGTGPTGPTGIGSDRLEPDRLDRLEPDRPDRPEPDQPDRTGVASAEQRLLIMDHGSRIMDQRSWIMDQVSWTLDLVLA